MLTHRLRRWSHIKTTLVQCFVFAGRGIRYTWKRRQDEGEGGAHSLLSAKLFKNFPNLDEICQKFFRTGSQTPGVPFVHPSYHGYADRPFGIRTSLSSNKQFTFLCGLTVKIVTADKSKPDVNIFFIKYRT